MPFTLMRPPKGDNNLRLEQKLSRYVLKFLVLLTFAWGAAPACAAEADTSFEAQCPLLLAQADSFAHACLLNAQPFQRDFNGVPEYHSAYLGPAAPGSHFGLGCTLDSNHQIAFLGVYYTLNPVNFKLANTAPVSAVDFDGNIGVILNGKLVNFIVVRPFQTKIVPLAYYAQGVKNCEKEKLPSGEVEDIQGQTFYVSEKHVGPSILIHGCLAFSASRSDDQCLDDGEYLDVVKSPSTGRFFVPTGQGYLNYLIESDGGILVRKELLQKYCPIYAQWEASGTLSLTGSVDVIQEVCLSGQF
jgi:hypothetical protein